MSELDLIRQIADLQRRLAIQETREATHSAVTLGANNDAALALSGQALTLTMPHTQEFRLTLETGVAVSTTDQLAKTNLYATPYIGNLIELYDGAKWNQRASNEFSISNAGLGNSTVYDVFCYDNAGVPTLELLAWASATARATALVRQNGVWCKTGALTRRYLGTVMTDSAGKFQKRFAGGVTAGAAAEVGVWNFHHRRKERYAIYDSTNNWSYSTAAWRGWDNNTQNRINTLFGLSEDVVSIYFQDTVYNLSGTALIYGILGVGLDSTTVLSADCLTDISQMVANLSLTLQAHYDGHPGIGSHYLQLLEYASTATIQFYGDSGLADIRCGAHCDVWA